MSTGAMSPTINIGRLLMLSRAISISINSLVHELHKEILHMLDLLHLLIELCWEGLTNIVPWILEMEVVLEPD